VTSCQGAKGTGTLYSLAQLEGLWINAGGSSTLAPVMAAIAMAESGGCSTAYNPSGATGLWQILGAVDPADQANLTDPATNAHEAVLKYQSQGLSAWTTYTSGAYKAYLSGSTTPDTSVPGSGSATATTTAATSSADCVWSWPSVDLGVTSLGGGCILSKAQARAILGGACVGAGLLIGLVGAVILAASVFHHSGADRAASQAVSTVRKVPFVP
jgi:Lysozyme like domain